MYQLLKRKVSSLKSAAFYEAMKDLAIKTFGTEKAKIFRTKALRSFYNSALLRASIQPQELKDLMMGHGRKGARGHYDFDEETIRQNYAKAFENLSINGLQTRTDVADLKAEFTENKLTFADTVAKQDKKNKKLESDLETVRGVLKGLQPIIDNMDEVVEFLAKRREEKGLRSRAEADADDRAVKEKVMKDGR